MIHTVKGFGIVNKVETHVFLELSCFFNDPADVGNLISGSSAFSAAAKLLQSCPTLCDPVDGSPAGSPILFFDVRLLQSCPTCCDPMHCSPPGSSVLGDSPGKNTGVGCQALL